jgi:hypothetical protein
MERPSRRRAARRAFNPAAEAARPQWGTAGPAPAAGRESSSKLCAKSRSSGQPRETQLTAPPTAADAVDQTGRAAEGARIRAVELTVQRLKVATGGAAVLLWTSFFVRCFLYAGGRSAGREITLLPMPAAGYGARAAAGTFAASALSAAEGGTPAGGV